ncbi:MAG: Crp/Fnr family transcriptional regulator, partial [Verrucomicrobiae bacterium]|nr:Crp/Fnr family transcriptional regulator [Verrucomicrobiae bacterium]
MPSESDIVALLSENETFAGTPADTLAALAHEAEQRDVAAGDELITQGVRCGSIFLAIEGEFGVFVKETPSDAPLAQLGRGRVFGEIGAVSGIVATATVRALSAGRVLMIPGPVLHKAMRQTPSLAESVLRSLARYLGP